MNNISSQDTNWQKSNTLTAVGIALIVSGVLTFLLGATIPSTRIYWHDVLWLGIWVLVIIGLCFVIWGKFQKNKEEILAGLRLEDGSGIISVRQPDGIVKPYAYDPQTGLFEIVVPREGGGYRRINKI